MIELIIKKYVNSLTKDQIVSFAKENNIVLTEHELSIIYNTIKTDWYTLIFKDYKTIFKKVEKEIEPIKLKKIEDLLLLYKNKFKDYL